VTKTVTIAVNHVGHEADLFGAYRGGFVGTTNFSLKRYGIDYDLGPVSQEGEIYMTTTLTLEQRKKLVEWMTDRSVDTDIDSQERTYRKQLLDDLDETQVREMANKEGIVLTDEHLGVIECLRDYFLEFGEAEKGRDLEEMLDEVFAGHGGRKYLWQLFPSGPVTQGTRIAGLPVPPHSGDKGFGTVR
jgi:TusE/DsrC/DsvC family sulfur relay protein